MESSEGSPDYLSHGLQRLLGDIHTTGHRTSNGLSHVVCDSSQLAGFSPDRVDYCGIDVTELARKQTFESVVWLLLTGESPTPEQEADAAAILREAAVVEQSAIDALAGLPLRTRPLEMLPLAVSVLSYFDPTHIDRSAAATRSRVWRMLAQLPVLLSCGLDGGRPNIAGETSLPRPSLAATILQMVRGTAVHTDDTPCPVEEEAISAVLICQCLTELRPACFAARFFGSTVSDVIPALRAATSLYVAQMRNDPYEWINSRLRGLQDPAHAELWLDQRKDGLLPFGFSLDEPDPRSAILQRVTQNLLGSERRIHIAACAHRLEQRMMRQDRYATMDWGTSVVLTLLDVPPERSSLVIAMARLVGWAAQALDQANRDVSLLPQLDYVSS